MSFLADQRNKKFVHKGEEETYQIMAQKTLNISLEELISSTAKNYSDAFNSKDILEIAICFGEHNLKPAGKKQLSKLQTISMAPTQEGENSKKMEHD